MFRTVPLCPSSGVFHCTHSNSLCHTCCSYSLRAGSGRNCPNCPKFCSKNKCEKLVHLVVFITRIFSCFCDKSNKDGASLKLCRHLNRQNCACLTPYWMFLIQILSWANLCFVVTTPTILDVCSSAVLLCTCTVRTWLAVNAPSAWKIHTSYLRTASTFCKYTQVFL